MQTHTHAHAHIHTHAHTHTYTHTQIHTHTQTHTHMQTHAHTHTHMHTDTHTHTQTHTHTHAHTHMHSVDNMQMCRQYISIRSKLFYSVVTPYNNNIVLPAIVTLVMTCVDKPCDTLIRRHSVSVYRADQVMLLYMDWQQIMLT